MKQLSVAISLSAKDVLVVVQKRNKSATGNTKSQYFTTKGHTPTTALCRYPHVQTKSAEGGASADRGVPSHPPSRRGSRRPG